MKLRDFELTVETADTDLRVRFRDQTRCVGALFADCLESAIDARGWKILVDCWSAAQAEARPKPKRTDSVYVALGVLRTGAVVDFEAFFRSSPEAKKRLAMDTLFDGIVRVARHEGLDVEIFAAAKRRAEERDLTHRWTTRPKMNPGRRLEGHLECLHDVDCFEAWLVIGAVGGPPIHRVSALRTRPSEYSFASKVYKTKWLDKNTFALLDKNLEVVCASSVSSEIH